MIKYNIKKFQADITRINKILPKKLREVKINFVDYGTAQALCAGGININFRGILELKELKEAFEIYLKKKLSLKAFFVLVYLHEAGHTYRHITGQADYERNRRELYFFNEDPDYIKRQLIYWNGITEEKEAWKFAKTYFKKGG